MTAAVGGRRRRVPVVLQANRAECGVACLTMVLRHHGHDVPIQEVRERCPVGRDGLSAGSIVRAARQFGLVASGYPAGPAALAQLPTPLIAHWADDHFVVVERISPRHVHVVDPRLGRRRLAVGEFHDGVGKVLLTARPGDGFTRRRTSERPFWQRYVRSLAMVPGTARLLGQIALVTLVAQLLVLAMPLATKIAVDELDVLRTSAVLPLLGAGLLVATLAQLSTGLVRAALLVRLQGRLDVNAQLGFCAHLLRLPLRYFEQRGTGDIVTRFGSITQLRDLLTSQTVGSVLDALLVLGYLAALFAVDAVVAVAVLVVVGAVAVLLVVTTPAVRERMALDLAAQGEAQGYLVEVLDGMPTLTAAAAEDQAMRRLSGLLSDWIAITLRRGQLTAVVDATATALRFGCPPLVLWLAVTRVLDGTLSVGTMLALTWLAAAIVGPLASLAGSGQRLQLAGSQLQRLADVLETPPRPCIPPPPADVRLTGRIELVDVGFRYDPAGPPVLRGVSATILPGQRVAVVGATGSGKTTLGMLLLGLYAPTSGRIMVDGQPLDELDSGWVRGQLGVVLQEPFVFSGTIRENIALHDPGLSRADLVRAAELAALADEIAALPLGYETRLAQRGTGLSGGQRQRLALARALAHRPAMLLLDEATSHLDADTEATVHRNLAAQPCTQVVIAHRLSTVRNADQILVLRGGELVESGTHDTLLDHGGHYARLITAQLDVRSGRDRSGNIASDSERR